MEADWQKDDWTRTMMSALSFTAWEKGSDEKKRLAAKLLGKQTDDR